MSKILIICDVFPPSFAPRMGYLVKYLKRFGWQADVVTRGYDGDYSFESLVGDERVIRINQVPTPMNTLKDKLKKWITQRKVFKQNTNKLAKGIINDLNPKDYRLILCSTAHRIFILNAAAEVASEWKKLWIADIRDINEQNPNEKPLPGIKNAIIHNLNTRHKNFMVTQRNKCLKQANGVVTITPWHVDQLRKYNKNTYLIYNGYYPEHFYPRQLEPEDQFRITYMGLIISNSYRDPTLLFLAVKKLAKNKLIDKKRFRIQFYTPKNKRKPILENRAYQDVRAYVDFFDYVDNAQVPLVLAQSSILLLLTNKFNSDGPKGIMTTKYFEYLAMKRPVLCVRSDEHILEDSINKAKAGIAAKTVDETYNFILENWREWKKKGYTTININSEYAEQFSRELQARQFIDIFNKTAAH